MRIIRQRQPGDANEEEYRKEAIQKTLLSKIYNKKYKLNNFLGYYTSDSVGKDFFYLLL